MRYVHSFKPVADAHIKWLILGSMPGRASLSAQEYYAFPQNSFWRIMASHLAMPAGLDYKQRCQALINNRIGLWDVLKSCTRSTSLDSDIVESSIIANDFCRFFQTHPHIDALYFNGAKAHTSYLKHVLPRLPIEQTQKALLKLPSTSPAHAAITFNDKLAAWRVFRP